MAASSAVIASSLVTSLKLPMSAARSTRVRDMLAASLFDNPTALNMLPKFPAASNASTLAMPMLLAVCFDQSLIILEESPKTASDFPICSLSDEAESIASPSIPGILPAAPANPSKSLCPILSLNPFSMLLAMDFVFFSNEESSLSALFESAPMLTLNPAMYFSLSSQSSSSFIWATRRSFARSM